MKDIIFFVEVEKTAHDAVKYWELDTFFFDSDKAKKYAKTLSGYPNHVRIRVGVKEGWKLTTFRSLDKSEMDELMNNSSTKPRPIHPDLSIFRKKKHGLRLFSV